MTGTIHTFSLRPNKYHDNAADITITNISSHQVAVLDFTHEELSDLRDAIDTYLDQIPNNHEQKAISIYFPSTDNTQDPTLSITIPTKDVTLNLTQSEAYDAIVQLSRQLAYNFGYINYNVNANNVIVFLADAYMDEDNHFHTYFSEDKDTISDFFELDKNTQQNIASDALEDTVNTLNICEIDVSIEEVLDEILLQAARSLVKGVSHDNN